MCRKLIGACVGLAMMGMAGAADALLISQDLNVAGDGLVTRDTSTGLDWLDVTATLGLSYNDAEATSFVTTQGFRHANTTEVATLFFNGGVIVLGTTSAEPFVAVNLPGVTNIISKLGCTKDCTAAGPLPLTQGLADLDPASPTTVQFPFVQIDLLGQFGPANFARAVSPFVTFSTSKDGSFSEVGNFLVRAPEPSTLALFATGLALLAFLGWRRRRAVQVKAA